MPTLSNDEEQYHSASNGNGNEEDKGEKLDYTTFLERFFE